MKKAEDPKGTFKFHKSKKTDNAISKNPLQTASKTKYKDTRTPLKTGASKDTTIALNVSFVVLLKQLKIW